MENRGFTSPIANSRSPSYPKRVTDVETFSVADAHSPRRKRLIVRADETLAAFLDLEGAVRAGSAAAEGLD